MLQTGGEMVSILGVGLERKGLYFGGLVWGEMIFSGNNTFKFDFILIPIRLSYLTPNCVILMNGSFSRQLANMCCCPACGVKNNVKFCAKNATRSLTFSFSFDLPFWQKKMDS